MTHLVDPWGRSITRLRLSVGDRCNLTCTYCRSRPHAGASPALPPLSADDFVAISEAAVASGIETIRLTGGEPLLRDDLPQITSRIAALAPAPDISLTTNGCLLADSAQALADAGLARVNVSLDSLRAGAFWTITGGSSPRRVIAGLAAARRAGLGPIKVNAVIVRGLNDGEILDLVRFADDRGYHIRFIEFMPLDAGRQWLPESVVPVTEIRGRVADTFDLTPLPHNGSPGDDYLIGEGPARLSLIGALTHPFCERCNRIRVTADGFVRPCLFSTAEHDLRPALAAAHRADALIAALAAAVADKPRGHHIGEPDFAAPARAMFAIGG